MKRTCLLIGLVGMVLAVASTAGGNDFYIYPKQGQSNEQMEKDKYDCHSWAKQQSGFDPMAPAAPSAPPPQSAAPQGGVVRGAARGALLGVTAGAIAGDAGKGAAIGAASGGLMGGMRSRDQASREKAAQQQYAQQQAANSAALRQAYNRAFTACMEGKGYTVK